MRPRGGLPSTGPGWSKALLVLAIVFLLLAIWNGALATTDSLAWRGVAVAGCALCSGALVYVAIIDRRR
jgi:hypothetical protein